MEDQQSEPRQEHQPYEPPAVIYEAPLEVRAGSVLSSPFDPNNPLGLGQK